MIAMKDRNRLQVAVPTPIRIDIAMHMRESLSCQAYDPRTDRGNRNGHRGWWATTPNEAIRSGVSVDFVCCGDVIQRARIVAVSPANGELLKRMYEISRTNTVIFTWEARGDA